MFAQLRISSGDRGKDHSTGIVKGKHLRDYQLIYPLPRSAGKSLDRLCNRAVTWAE
jgi:hypothetical protein